MKPFIFQLGDIQIPSFFFMIMIATLAATFYGVWLGRRSGLRPEYVLDMGIVGMLSAVIGARIFHILVEAPDYYIEHPLYVFHFWRGGFVSIGGFIGILLGEYFYLRWRQVIVWDYIDLLAALSPIIFFCVRVACLMTGCCYGKPTNLPWAIHFSDPASTAHYYFGDTPLHPTQIYGMIQAVILFIVINWVYQKRKFPGQTAMILLMLYAIMRSIVEMFRGDVDRGVYFGGAISTAQVSGAVIFLLAAAGYWWLAKRNRPSPPTNP